jgi:hypothetical protein
MSGIGMQTPTQTASPQVHAVQPSGPDHCILLSGVRWETYESLLTDMQDSHAAHFAYDRGVLEIMAPSYEHDNLKHIIAVLVEVLAGEMEIDIEGGGSTTFRRQDLATGFEPDACFYIQHAERVRGKKQIDLAQDPPPDLIIEYRHHQPVVEQVPHLRGTGDPGGLAPQRSARRYLHIGRQRLCRARGKRGPAKGLERDPDRAHRRQQAIETPRLAPPGAGVGTIVLELDA